MIVLILLTYTLYRISYFYMFTVLKLSQHKVQILPNLLFGSFRNLDVSESYRHRHRGPRIPFCCDFLDNMEQVNLIIIKGGDRSQAIPAETKREIWY
jgi:hypothetical protein